MLTEDAPFTRVELTAQAHPESSWTDRTPIGRVLGAVEIGLWALAGVSADWILLPMLGTLHDTECQDLTINLE